MTGGTLGPWTLLEVLGKGGNGEVWRASRAGEEHARAVKVIRTHNIEREPYQRFVREISFLRDHPHEPGVLPFVDAYLPDEPSRANQPWLAMPIATPIRTAVQDMSLLKVIAAVTEIAETLVRLQEAHDLAHRDLKPGNLYELEGRWLIGDFGLIAIPDADSLTQDGKQVGPAHFTAYEMITDPTNANPHLADVYSFGKTLWVLAAGQTFPPEGHQPAGMRQFRIGDFWHHPRAEALDQEVDAMTRIYPDDRPSKAQVARDLREWLSLPEPKPLKIDVMAARSAVRSKLKKEILLQDSRTNYKEQAFAATRRLQKLTEPFNAVLKGIWDRTQVDKATDELTQKLLKTTHMPYPTEVIYRWQRCTIVKPLDGSVSTALRMSRCLELMNDGELVLHLMVHVAPDGVMGMDYHWDLGRRASAPVGTIEAEAMLVGAIEEMEEGLQSGIQVLIDRLPDLST